MDKYGPNNCLIVAGEKSGEEHCMSFFLELKKQVPEVSFWGVGGDLMEQNGFEKVFSLKDFSSWGFSEVIKKIPFYFNALNTLTEKVEQRNTKTAILIDFQDFNLRLAKRLKKKGVNVLYYVAPQAWAWKAGRARVLQECVHSLFTIIPFEKNWFLERGVSKTVSIAHPVYRQYKDQLDKTPDLKEINSTIKLLLLPGSRDFEVKYLLPIFAEAIKTLSKQYQLEVSLVKSPNVSERLYSPYLSLVNSSYQSEELPQALKKAHLSFAASGTVTLTTALFSVPTVVAYKTSLLNEYIFENFINYDGFASLANIIHEEQVFPELIQNEATGFNLSRFAKIWIDNPSKYRDSQLKLNMTKDLVKGDDKPIVDYITSVICNEK